MPTPKFLENIVILCFERRFPKQNSVISLKSNILAPQIFGLATALDGNRTTCITGIECVFRKEQVWLHCA